MAVPLKAIPPCRHARAPSLYKTNKLRSIVAACRHCIRTMIRMSVEVKVIGGCRVTLQPRDRFKDVGSAFIMWGVGVGDGGIHEERCTSSVVRLTFSSILLWLLYPGTSLAMMVHNVILSITPHMFSFMRSTLRVAPRRGQSGNLVLPCYLLFIFDRCDTFFCILLICCC